MQEIPHALLEGGILIPLRRLPSLSLMANHRTKLVLNNLLICL